MRWRGATKSTDAIDRNSWWINMFHDERGFDFKIIRADCCDFNSMSDDLLCSIC